MLTSLTGTIEFWIVFSTALIGVGAYKLITKQNSEQIKVLGEKIDSFSFEIRLDQVRANENLKTINEKVNRIEGDTTAMRAQGSMFSESIAKMQIRVDNLEREHRKNEAN
jgi:outer membrane murein-binding lipoprotein Lpp